MMDNMKSALRARRMKGMKGEDPTENADGSPIGKDMSDLAPLPDHSDQEAMPEDGMKPGDQISEAQDGDGVDMPVIGVDKQPGKTIVSVEVPSMGGPEAGPNMDDLRGEMLDGMSDQDQASLMNRAPKSLGEAARKAAIMSKKPKM